MGYSQAMDADLSLKVQVLEQRIEKLQASVDTLYELNQLAATTYVAMTDAELALLYTTAERVLSEPTFDALLLAKFGEVLLRLTEAEIERINTSLQVTDSWLTFFRVCVRAMRVITHDPELSMSEPLRTLYVKYQMGRKNLTKIAAFFTTRDPLTPPHRQFLNHAILEEIDTFDALALTFKKAGGLSNTEGTGSRQVASLSRKK